MKHAAHDQLGRVASAINALCDCALRIRPPRPGGPGLGGLLRSASVDDVTVEALRQLTQASRSRVIAIQAAGPPLRKTTGAGASWRRRHLVLAGAGAAHGGLSRAAPGATSASTSRSCASSGAMPCHTQALLPRPCTSQHWRLGGHCAGPAARLQREPRRQPVALHAGHHGTGSLKAAMAATTSASALAQS